MNTIFKINDSIQISGVIIIYEVIILLLTLFKIINYKTSQNLLSWFVLLNFFIIFVMFLTNCTIPSNILLFILFIKIILLIIILFIAKFTIKNYAISVLVLFIYYILSDINKVYSCNIKNNQLFLSLFISSIFYFVLMLK